MGVWRWISVRIRVLDDTDVPSPESVAHPHPKLPAEVPEPRVGQVEPPGEYGDWLAHTSRSERAGATKAFAARFRPADDALPAGGQANAGDRSR